MMPGRLEAGIPYLEQKGFKVKLGKHIKNANRFLAGTDKERAQDIMDFFSDPEVKAIVATGGGYGTQRILPLLDYEIIGQHPKIVVGFSDTTGLQLGLLSKTGLISYSGFLLADTMKDDMPSQVEPLIDQTLMSCLQLMPYSITEGVTVNPGKVEGRLIGGNSDLIVALHGTPYQPDYRGCIFLVEEVRLEPYKVDAMLSHLALLGIFDQVAGVIFGKFEDCIARRFPERDGTVDDVIDEWSSRLTVPCLKNFPYGHQRRRCVLPIGQKILLDADNHSVRISWDK
jgi:muramoyltetrapeptide carboxypeptidase